MLSKKVQELATDYNGIVGKLPKYGWPGGYPLFYVNDSNEILCSECASDHEQSEETIVDCDVNWEDAFMYCDSCSERIESAYAEDELEKEDIEL